MGNHFREKRHMDKKSLAQYSQYHECCPKDWRRTHVITGNHELDAVIERSENGDVPSRLEQYVSTDEAYGPITGYSAYRGYRGDN